MIKPLLFASIVVLLSNTATNPSFAQIPGDQIMNGYRASAPHVNDLVHTRLDVHFDYRHRYLIGKEWVTLTPHFYPTDSLCLDARGMEIKQVALLENGQSTPLKFSYDGLSIAIHLNRPWRRHESYTIYIDYIAKPNELTFADNTLSKYNRGLYFVNPDSTEKGKPVQIYTQGETENASAWFPTIDKPDQKTTDEIRLTVPEKYITLSNGRLADSRVNSDGTRTDTWKMDLPQPPYLFMLAVGNFRVYHDHWRNKPVDYYLEPAYAPFAKQIFGNTPEIIDYFSRILQYDFPWNKYAQIVVRDYASGGMENTTATLLNEYVQQTPRQLLDAYYSKGQSTIVHELFHQWFGALVTCKSWSNQAVDETFAEFSDGLWAEHKYGRDEADALRYQDLQTYLKRKIIDTLPMVRYHYDNELDMFDVLTYCKGNGVLNMLRNYLGDSAFFKGLNRYLKTNAFKNAEVEQIRLALEETTGRDLHWFFDQWYFRAGHPVLDISYRWDHMTKTETIYLRQTQDGMAFILPMAVDIYNDGQRQRYNIFMKNKDDTLSFRADKKPDLVNVDGDKVLVADIMDHKTPDEYIFQYFHAPLYLDRLQAINAAMANPLDPQVRKILIAAVHDKYYGLRITALHALDLRNDTILTTVAPLLTDLAQSDTNTLVRAAALTALGNLKASKYLPLFEKALNNPSYTVEAAALIAIDRLDHDRALTLARRFEKDNSGPLTTAIKAITATPR
jgi:aminopeptidase N